MARIHMLKTLVNERLREAAEEIFGVFERTITEYEQELDRQRNLLDLALKPKTKCRKADGPPLFVCAEEVPPEPQEWSPRLGQEDPEPPQIEEEQEELWTSQGGEQLQGLEEEDEEEAPDIIKFTFTPIPVKSEHDEEKPRSSWFNQTQTEPLPSTSTERIKTEPDGEDCGVSEPARNLDPAGHLETTNDGLLLISDCSETDTEDNDEDVWKETVGEPSSCLNALKSKTPTLKGQSLSIINNFQRSMELFHELKSPNQIPSSPCCQVCGKSYPNKKSLMSHVKVHPSDCGLCGKHLEPAENLKIHFQAHSTCGFCGKRSTSIAALERHIKTHTGEKPFSCSVCSEAFRQKGYLKIHMRVHTGERPFSCSVCGKGFGQKGHLMRHWRSHIGEKTI